MNIFKESKVTLHSIEKIGIMMTTFVISFMFFMCGYIVFNNLEGFHKFVGLIGMVLSAFYPGLVYFTLHGKGLIKTK